MNSDEAFEKIHKALKAMEEKEAEQRKMRSRAEANDKYNPRCPKCGLRVLYCVYGLSGNKIENFDRRGILYQHMGCFIPQKRFYYICPDCKIGFDRKLKPMEEEW